MLRDAFITRKQLPALWLLVSTITHLCFLIALPNRTQHRTAARTTINMELYQPVTPQVEKPKEKEKPKVKAKPRAKAKRKYQHVVKPRPEAPPPPPPSPSPSPPPPSSKPTPIVIGISLSSTTAAGGFAVPVGNTTYGKASTNPEKEVRPYAGQGQPGSQARYAAPGSVDVEPEVISEVKIPYPPQARRTEIEGTVRLKVTLSAQGVVENVLILSGPGYGLNEAARDALRRFKFKPAQKSGEAVGYTFFYAYTFWLD